MTAFHYATKTSPDSPKIDLSKPSANFILDRDKRLLNSPYNLKYVNVKSSAKCLTGANKESGINKIFPDKNFSLNPNITPFSKSFGLPGSKSRSKQINNSLFCNQCQRVMQSYGITKVRAHKSLRQPIRECIINSKASSDVSISSFNNTKAIPNLSMVVSHSNNSTLNISNPNKLNTNHNTVINQYEHISQSASDCLNITTSNKDLKISQTPLRPLCLLPKSEAQHTQTNKDQISSQAALNKVFFPHHVLQSSHALKGLSKNFAIFTPKQVQIIQMVAGTLRDIGDEFEAKYNPAINTNPSKFWPKMKALRHFFPTANIIIVKLINELLVGGADFLM